MSLIFQAKISKIDSNTGQPYYLLRFLPNDILTSSFTCDRYMLKMFKKNKTREDNDPKSSTCTPVIDKNLNILDNTTQTNGNDWLSRLHQGMSKTRQGLGSHLRSILGSHQPLDTEVIETLETLLLSSDVGTAATQEIIQDLNQRKRKELRDPNSLLEALRTDLINILQPCEVPLTLHLTHKPFVMLVIGVNGSGKTTTIGKLAQQYQTQKKSVMLAAGDTFRAAAIEQLQTWGGCHGVPVVAQHSGADSASVVFDALESARARQCDLLIADTAGRLHTQQNLMTELQKVKRVLSKLDDTAPHEVLLVLDASIGQNALQQAKEFNKAIGVTGIAITKLDGTAKGGILFAIAKQLQIPIRFIGVGEGVNDLHPFSAAEFVSALFE